MDITLTRTDSDPEILRMCAALKCERQISKEVKMDEQHGHWSRGLCGLWLVYQGLDELKVLGSLSVCRNDFLPLGRRIHQDIVDLLKIEFTRIFDLVEEF